MRDFTGQSNVPLACDLDGTLTRTDTTYELLILFLKANPLLGWLTLLIWLRAGRAQMKENLFFAVGAQLHVGRLPFNQALIESDLFRSAEHRSLVSGAAQPVVDNVAREIGGFEDAIGTAHGRNLTSRAKAELLATTYPDGYDYIGNSTDDIAVWAKAHRAFAVNARPSVISAARSRGIDLQILVPRASQRGPLLKAMRLHQWIKNVLIFVVPALNLAHFTPEAFLGLLATFLAFGLVASATYMFNDLLDIQEDRRHHSKATRPFAAGTLDIVNGVLAIAAFFAVGMGIALLTDPATAGMLLIYAIISLVYSLYLKKVVIIDAMALAFLFCWRILVGSVAFGADTNVWFMTAVGAFFLSLAFGKRCIELGRKADMAGAPGADKAALHGRGYQVRDFPVILGLGLVTGMVAPLIVLIYFYLSGSSIVDHTPSALSLAALLCFWIARFWLLVNRGEVQDDPIVFALKDRASFGLLAAMAIVLVVEQLN